MSGHNTRSSGRGVEYGAQDLDRVERRPSGTMSSPRTTSATAPTCTAPTVSTSRGTGAGAGGGGSGANTHTTPSVSAAGGISASGAGGTPPPPPPPPPQPVGTRAAEMEALLSVAPTDRDGGELDEFDPDRVAWERARATVAEKKLEAELLLSHQVRMGEELMKNLADRVATIKVTLREIKGDETGSPEHNTKLGQLVYHLDTAEADSKSATKVRRDAAANLFKAGLAPARLAAFERVIDGAFAEETALGMEVKVLKTELAAIQREVEYAGRNFKPKTVEVRKYSGEKMSEYYSFKNHFQTTFGRMGLTDAQRYHFLKDHLTKEPLLAISKLSIADASYHEAWKILDRHYGDKTLIKTQLLEELNSMSFKSDSNPKELRKFIDSVDLKFRRLKEVDPDMGTQNAVLLPLMEKIFPYQLRKDMQPKLSGPDPVTVDAFLKAAGDQVREEIHLRGDHKGSRDGGWREKKPNSSTKQHGGGRGNGGGHSMAGLAGMAARNGGAPGPSSFKGKNSAAPTGAGKGGGRNKGKQSGSFPSGKSPAQARQCPNCRGSHSLTKCDSFLKLSTADRKNKVAELKICYICFSPNHFSRDCKSKSSCTAKQNGKKCGSRKHNTLLHSNSAKK